METFLAIAVVFYFAWYVVGVTGAWLIFKRIAPEITTDDVMTILFAGFLGPLVFLSWE